jgi:hypothetical protein
MKGYLDRLVHTVSHPRETVHPRTGALFAPYRSEPDSPPDWFEQAETVVTNPTRSDSRPIGEPADTARHPTGSDHSQSPLHPETADEPPRVIESVRHADLPPPAGYEAKHDTLEHAAQVPRRLVAPPAQHAVPESRRAAAVQSYVPLIHPQLSEPHGTGPETPQFVTEARSISAAGANFPAERRVTGAEREPDEIQIHIGRIEVTAVQPPAPRAAKPPDNPLSLDAYLERRNGRAR